MKHIDEMTADELKTALKGAAVLLMKASRLFGPCVEFVDELHHTNCVEAYPNTPDKWCGACEFDVLFNNWLDGEEVK